MSQHLDRYMTENTNVLNFWEMQVKNVYQRNQIITISFN